MNARREAYLYAAQRLTALVMAPLVIGHLITIIVAIQGGLSAEEILSRTSGNLFWAAFYGLFVLAAGIHAALGLRMVAAEWLGFRGPLANWTVAAIGLLLILLGFRAVGAVI